MLAERSRDGNRRPRLLSGRLSLLLQALLDIGRRVLEAHVALVRARRAVLAAVVVALEKSFVDELAPQRDGVGGEVASRLEQPVLDARRHLALGQRLPVSEPRLDP